MQYPLISEYIEAISSPEDNFSELTNLRPVIGSDRRPVMSSGNFAVVFRMTDGSRDFAVKCFLREQEGRDESYRRITDELQYRQSPFLVSVRYMENELFVDTSQTDVTEFPVLLMDWVDGVCLDKYIIQHANETYALAILAYRFSALAQWLLTQPFAHGDLKPENILVSDDGSLTLIDYDGMFVPAMEGETARELSSPNFRHP